ncbi:unnamed protein product [Symbiodinium sp. CCMP2592]|nr:unnamed protein product [Symbiodinium sp. CCMP2592]
MAWLATHGVWDVVVLQETHWGITEDFSSGEWSCVHSSGHSAKDGPDKSAGILIMVSRKAFRNIATQEHVPSRLLQVRAYHNQSQHNVDILGLYQHVHRTTLSASQNRRLRQGVWHALQQTLDTLPARNKVILAGDFNSTLSQAPPGVGPSVPHPDTHDNHDATLQQLLLDYELCALNTWHARPKHTFFSTTTRSQLDYLIVKCTDAGATAKLSAPLTAFPVTGDRLSNHIPVQASLQLRPLRHQPKDRQAQPAFDKAALHQAIESGAPQASMLQQAVSARVEALPAPASINSLHHEINSILLQETCRLFPPQGRADHRVSADPGFRASAARTWSLYRAVKRPGVVTLANILQRWRVVACFHKASKELKQQSRQLKVAFHRNQLHQAEEAASAGNLRELFQITRRLGPRKARVASRLKDENGNIMTEQAELATVMKYGQETFAAIPDSRQQLPLLEDLTFGPDEIWHELSHLKHQKAVPSHCAPSAVWKLCAQDLYQPLSTALNLHFKAGCADAIHRVHRHFDEVEQIIQKNQSNRFTMRQGHVPSRCAGGACLSLDLSKAFDFVDRNHLTDTLLEQGIPPNVVAAIQQLHKQARYHYDIRSRQGCTITTNGIKQGCRVAPALWLCYSISVLQALARQRDLGWLHRIITLFADDWCGVILDKLANLILSRDPTYSITGANIVVNADVHTSLRDLQVTMQSISEGAASQAAAEESTEAVECPHCKARVLNSHALSIHMSLRHQDIEKPAAEKCRFDPVRHSIAGMPTCRLCLRNFTKWQQLKLHITRKSCPELGIFQASHKHRARQLHRTMQSQEKVRLHFRMNCRHSTQCVVLNQLALAYEFCKRGMHQPLLDQDGYGGFGSEHLRALHAHGGGKGSSRIGVPTGHLESGSTGPPGSSTGGEASAGPRLWQQPRHQPHAPQMPPQMPPPYPTAEHQIDILSKLVLKHEEALHNLRKDTAYVLFFRQDEKSLVPNLMEVARQWREKAASATPDPGLQSPLRTVLINCLLKELLQRTQRVVATEAGRADLQKMGWLDSQGHWTYLKWSPQQRRLVLNEAKSPITHDTMVKTITELQASMTGEIIHRFKSKQPMWAIEEEGSSQAVFDLEIALRGATSDEVHQNFGILAGSAVTNLIGLSMKRDDRHILPHVFRTIPTAPINAMAELGFFLMGWAPYVIRALITHHGEHLATGHYRTLIREGETYWLQDDARRAVKASEAQLTDASSCVYLMLLIRKTAAETATVAPSSSSVALRRSLDDAFAAHQPEHELVARASSICHATAIDDSGSPDRTDEVQIGKAGAESSTTGAGAASTSDETTSSAYASSKHSEGISPHSR